VWPCGRADCSCLSQHQGSNHPPATISPEALHLALRNAAVILDGGVDAVHRTFRCLYGVERHGRISLIVVPSSVTFASTLQKAISALLIFLFGLAIRNMLRMK
jgi:hypothetical protein